MHDSAIQHLEFLGIVPFGSDSFVPASAEEIEAVEEELGVFLPGSYKCLLNNYGEFAFSRPVAFTGEDRSCFDFGYLYGLQSLLENAHDPPYDFPPGLLAIGEEGLGNIYCLQIKGSPLGRILYWDHEIACGEEAEFYMQQELPIPDPIEVPCLYTMAPSFDSFLSRLELSSPDTE